MNEITIPPEAGLAMANEIRRQCGIMVSPAVARAAIRAALAAWPGMGPIRTDQPIGDWCDKLPAIILPLPQESEA